MGVVKNRSGHHAPRCVHGANEDCIMNKSVMSIDVSANNHNFQRDRTKQCNYFLEA